MVSRFAAATLVFVGVWSLVAGPAAAQDTAALSELVGDSATIVVVDPESSTIDVTHRYTFENTTTDQAFSGFFETLPAEARAVEATARGSSLPAVNIPDGDGFAEWLVTFDDALDPGESIEVELTWQRTGLRGDPDAFDRASRDLVALDPFPVGHRGASSLEVRVPGEWEVVVADEYTLERADGELVLRLDDATAFEYVSVPVVLDAPDRFSTTELEAGPVSVTVATADGASTWLSGDLAPLVEGLAEWIPLDPPTDLVFRQGFTGGADLRRDGDVLVLPFEASPVVAARAVAAAWLEPMPFDDAGLRDDLAAGLADRVARSEGLATLPGGGRWSNAMVALVSVADESTMTTILTALDGGVPAYGGADDAFDVDEIGWRRFTDVAEHLGGIESAGDAMRLSADVDQIAELDRRDAALVDYRALEARAAPWLLPPLLRDAMADWAFDRFTASQSAVSDLVAARDEMTAAAESVELTIGDHVRQEFESAGESMDEAWTLFVEQRESLDHVAEALRLDTGDRGLLSSLGMAGRDAPGQLDAMRAAWDAGHFEDAAERAEHLVEDYESSVGRGTLRLLAPLAGIVLVGAVIRLLRRRARQPQPLEV